MIIEHSEAKALLVSDRLFTKLSAADHRPAERRGAHEKPRSPIAQHVREAGATGIPQPGDLAVIIYTSGTTSQTQGG